MTDRAGRDPSPGPPGREALDRFPFLRASRHRWVPERVWEGRDAVAAVVPGRRGAMLVGAGDPGALAELVAQVGLPDVGHVMLTRGTHRRMTPALRTALEPGRPWDWLVAGEPPGPLPGEDAVRRVAGPGAPADGLERVHDCLDAGYPERGHREHDDALVWWGVEAADGPLDGVVAADVPPAADLAAGAGVHLEAVTVRPDRRREGVAAAMTAVVTRWGLGLGPLVHLGIWSDNGVARGLYTGLGFTVAHRVENLRPTAT